MNARIDALFGVLHSKSFLRSLSEHYLAQYPIDSRAIRLLDAGSGTRPVANRIITQRFPNADIITTDIDRAKAPHVLADLSGPWPFAEGSFDCIFSSFLLEHLPDPFHFFHEAARCLVPGGSLIVCAPFLHKYHGVPQDYFRFTDTALTRACSNYGLHVVGVRPLTLRPLTNAASHLIGFVPLKIVKFGVAAGIMAVDELFAGIARVLNKGHQVQKLSLLYALGWIVEASRPSSDVISRGTSSASQEQIVGVNAAAVAKSVTPRLISDKDAGVAGHSQTPAEKAE